MENVCESCTSCIVSGGGMHYCLCITYKHFPCKLFIDICVTRHDYNLLGYGCAFLCPMRYSYVV
jgi:hypothetical protein